MLNFYRDCPANYHVILRQGPRTKKVPKFKLPTDVYNPVTTFKQNRKCNMKICGLEFRLGLAIGLGLFNNKIITNGVIKLNKQNIFKLRPDIAYNSSCLQFILQGRTVVVKNLPVCKVELTKNVLKEFRNVSLLE